MRRRSMIEGNEGIRWQSKRVESRKLWELQRYGGMAVAK